MAPLRSEEASTIAAAGSVAGDARSSGEHALGLGHPKPHAASNGPDRRRGSTSEPSPGWADPRPGYVTVVRGVDGPRKQSTGESSEWSRHGRVAHHVSK